MKKGNLTKKEAYTAMIAGHKVSREYFGSDEYIYMENGIIKSEEGYSFNKWWKSIEPTIPSTGVKCWRVKDD